VRLPLLCDFPQKATKSVLMIRRRTPLLYGSSGTDEDSLDVSSIEEECRILGSLRWSFGDFSFRRCTRYEVSLSCRSQRLMILADVFMTCSGDTHSRSPAFLSIPNLSSVVASNIRYTFQYFLYHSTSAIGTRPVPFLATGDAREAQVSTLRLERLGYCSYRAHRNENGNSGYSKEKFKETRERGSLRFGLNVGGRNKAVRA